MRDQNNFIESYKIINFAKEKFPNESLIYIESCLTYKKDNKIDQAIVDIKMAIKLDPKSEIAHSSYAIILDSIYIDALNEQDISDAQIEEYYRSTLIQYMNVLSINMYNLEILCNYGAVNANYANWYITKVRSLIDKSIELFKENKLKESTILKEKAKIYYMYASQYNMEAETKYQYVLELDPLDHITHYNLGLVLKFFNNFDGAKYHFNKVIEINPSFIEASNELKLLG